MVKQSAIEAALRLERLGLPERPRIAEVRAEPHVDSAGEDAIRVWVILGDETQDDQMTWQQLKPVVEAVHGALQRAEIDLWPYVRFRRESECPGADEEE